MDTQQRIEKAIKEKQERIDRAIQKKEFRQSKTEISIGFRWSINCAISFLPEKLRGTKKGFKQLKKWQLEFENWDREYMLENIPIEPAGHKKLTRQDFAVAKAEAPKSQAETEMAEDAHREEAIKEANAELERFTPSEGSLPIINQD